MILLRAFAALAVEQTSKADGLIPADALTALQMVAFRSTQTDVGFDLRTGHFNGSLLADDPTQRYAHLDNSDLLGVDLVGSGLYRAHFHQANLRQANLSGSNLAGADLSNSGLSNTTFCPGLNYAVPEMVHNFAVRTGMVDTNFSNSSGENTRFDGARMYNTRFENANLMAPILVHTILDNAHFENAVLENPDFRSSDLKDASLKGATLVHPKFNDAVMINTDLRGVKGLARLSHRVV